MRCGVLERQGAHVEPRALTSLEHRGLIKQAESAPELQRLDSSRLLDVLCHQHHQSPDRRARTASPAAGSRRGPHPKRPRHRPAQPAPAQHRPKPHLAGDRTDRPRPAGLNVDARSDRHRPALGTPPPATPPVHRSRTARHHRTQADPPPRPALALDRREHRRPQPARTPAEPRLTSNLHTPTTAARHRSSGTRRHPETRLGPPAYPPAIHGTKRPTDSVGGPS